MRGLEKNHNSRVKKHEQKKKEEDPEVFRENTNKRQREVDAKKKAKDLEGFRENVRQRKLKSNSKFSAAQRLDEFRKRVQHGPIFVCSCCHLKLFSNQVEELTEKLKEQIDITNPEIKAQCMAYEIKVELGSDEYI